MSKWTLIFCFACVSVFAQPTVFVGIAGGTGSGKTTLAEKIHRALPGSVLILQDAYYKDRSEIPWEERERVNYDHPDAINFSQMREHLLDLKQGRAIERPTYSFVTHTVEWRTERIEPAPVVIVEGILLFAIPEVRELFDVKIFVDTEADVRILRRIDRDMKERLRTFDSIKEQYLTTVKPMHDAFVEPSKKFADIIVPEGGYNETALDLILAKLKQAL